MPRKGRVDGAQRKRGPKPKLENRPDAEQLLAEVLQPGANLSAIAVRVGVSRNTLAQWRDKRMPKPLQAIIERAGNSAALEAVQLDVLTRFIDAIEKSHTMLKAADEWLRDPKDPSRYNLSPRTHEVDVVYEETVGELTIKRAAPLSQLLATVEQGLGVTVVRGETKVADTRELHLKAVAAMSGVLEKYGKATGQIKPDPAATVNVLVLPETRAHLDRVAAAFEACAADGCTRCIDAWGARR